MADLQDIGNLENYVRKSGVVLYFLSKRYFSSRNCLREVRASLEENFAKPYAYRRWNPGSPRAAGRLILVSASPVDRLVLVHEQQEDKGGGPLEAMRMECPEAMRSQIFDGRDVITWHRVLHYQNLTLKLIATEMLRHGPKYSRGSFCATEDEPPLALVLPGEVSAAELAMPRPLVLWCSAGNPGAEDFARELQAELVGGEESIRVVTNKPHKRALDSQGESVAMLLYLNKVPLCRAHPYLASINPWRPPPHHKPSPWQDTWIEPNESKVLERDVRLTHTFAHSGLTHTFAHGGIVNELGAGLQRIGSNINGLVRMGSTLKDVQGNSKKKHGSGNGEHNDEEVQIIMVHENDPSKGGCDFDSFFGRTPQKLIDEGIYKEIAIALHTAPHRAISLALVAQALGATKSAAQALSRSYRRGSTASPGSRRSSMSLFGRHSSASLSEKSSSSSVVRALQGAALSAAVKIQASHCEKRPAHQIMQRS